MKCDEVPCRKQFSIKVMDLKGQWLVFQMQRLRLLLKKGTTSIPMEMHQVVNIGADRNGGTQRDGYNARPLLYKI